MVIKCKGVVIPYNISAPRAAVNQMSFKRTARHWCFTWNNPDPEHYDGTLPVRPSSVPVRYVVWQRERGESGTEHLQGYAELSQPVRLSAVRGWLPSAHWEPRAGPRDSARDYCRKEDGRCAGPWEHGTFEQGGQVSIALLFVHPGILLTLCSVACRVNDPISIQLALFFEQEASEPWPSSTLPSSSSSTEDSVLLRQSSKRLRVMRGFNLGPGSSESLTSSPQLLMTAPFTGFWTDEEGWARAGWPST